MFFLLSNSAPPPSLLFILCPSSLPMRGHLVTSYKHTDGPSAKYNCNIYQVTALSFALLLAVCISLSRITMVNKSVINRHMGLNTLEYSM
jgi:hypothetical protein